jgi:alkylhydroperoxidase/carboxymuconolactone decarboxylase family protein YurZ
VSTGTEQEALRARFLEIHGSWNPALQALLDADPVFFEAYAALAAAPWRTGTLDPKVKELISIAVDGAATHLYEPGFREHVRRAIALGATQEELLEVLELTSTLGIHACNIGVPILVQELGEEARAALPPLTDRHAALRRRFEENRGYWHPFWEEILQLDADFFEAYLEFSSVPWRHGVLEPKLKELVYIAFDASATHLYVPGLRLHIQNALGLGASAAEVMEVLELASVIGIHTCTMGVPIVLEELARAAASPGEWAS